MAGDMKRKADAMAAAGGDAEAEKRRKRAAAWRSQKARLAQAKAADAAGGGGGGAVAAAAAEGAGGGAQAAGGAAWGPPPARAALAPAKGFTLAAFSGAAPSRRATTQHAFSLSAATAPRAKARLAAPRRTPAHGGLFAEEEERTLAPLPASFGAGGAKARAGEGEGADGGGGGVAAAQGAEADNAASSVVDGGDAGAGGAAVDAAPGADPAQRQGQGGAEQQQQQQKEEEDPLDAFMAAEVLPEIERRKAAEEEGATGGGAAGGAAAQGGGRELPISRFGDGADESDEDEEAERERQKRQREREETDADWAKRITTGKSKSERMKAVDHEEKEYEPFRKALYIESAELKAMGDTEREALKDKLEVRVRGKGAPCPLTSWFQCGLSERVLAVIKKNKFELPTPIQAQALPAIMAGRDVIGIAKTGSGKTLAFVLPMLRHVMDQRPLEEGEGMIALVMAPTRELARQIYQDIGKFAKALGLRAVASYGGANIATQIAAFKAGCEIAVATPGRFIDVLTTGGGKVTNLARVTYLVLDEADRMFDMGFEPQISKIIANTRPDRQTVMFSATFPRQVELLARDALLSPLEILVGGKSVVNRDIDQHVEVRQEEERYLRTLELLGDWFELGKVIIFVQSQQRCDRLFQDLLNAGYPCLTLHGGMDQADRDGNIADFKGDVCNMIVATSVAARGLDVPQCRLVINYDCPNHMEDYVHRVGRTGRAGNKGTAYTFIGPDEAAYAQDIIKALDASGQHVPLGLRAINYQQKQKLLLGCAKTAGSGFGGKGYRFDNDEANANKEARKAEMKLLGGGGGGGGSDSESDSDDGVVRTAEEEARERAKVHAKALIAQAQEKAKAEKGTLKPIAPGLGVRQAVAAPTRGGAGTSSASVSGAGAGASGSAAGGITDAQRKAGVTEEQRKKAQEAALRVTKAASAAMSQAMVMHQSADNNALVKAAQDTARTLSLQLGGGPVGPSNHAPLPSLHGHFHSEIEINDFPQQARWKVTSKEAVSDLERSYDVALTPKGVYVKKGSKPPPGERKLYIIIEGKSEMSVRRCRAEMKKRIEDEVRKLHLPSSVARAGGRYQV